MELRLENLTKKYGEKAALDRATISFREGIYGILGSNGAGKSTMMNLIADNLSRTDGRIFWNGEEILQLGAKFREQIGYMPQQQGFYDQFSGRAFLVYMAELKGIPQKEAKGQIEELLKVVHLSEGAHRKIRGYSGGMKQRLLLAQALLGDPKLLLLDEPTAGLDPKERIRLRNYIKELSRNKIVLITTHIVSDVESIADQIMLMKEGKIVKQGTVLELLEEVTGRKSGTGSGAVSLEDVYLHYLGDSEE